MYNRIFVCLVFFLVVCSVLSQSNDTQKYRLVARETNIGLGELRLNDPYLSPISYSGFSLRADYLTRSFVSVNNSKWSYQLQFDGSLGLLSNPTGSASMLYAATQLGWGMNYHIRLSNGFQILTGGLVDGQFGLKWLSRNVNNPVNMDMAINLNAVAEARYDFSLWKQQLRFCIRLQSPVVGTMFVPVLGASYYEMFGLGNMEHTIHFSSLYNKRTLNSNINLQIPLRKITLLVGVATDNRLYKANQLVYRHNASYLSFGLKANVYQFGGARNVAPTHFLSTDK